MDKKDYNELIEILEFIKDKVIVTGSYANQTQTETSDIDFFCKTKTRRRSGFRGKFC